MKRTTCLILLALVAALLPSTAAVAQTDPVYTFTGSGWGHGVGMSQYGARALARSGRTAEEILDYYYEGVSVESIDEVLSESHWLRDDPAPLWIGLAQEQTLLKFHVHGPGTAQLCNTDDSEGECPTQIAVTGETWEFRALGGGTCQFFHSGQPVGNPGGCQAEIIWEDQPETRIHLDDHGEYGRGTIRMRPVAQGFHVLLQIGIEEYVYGLGEMPSDWHHEALEAQAIAARTYGLRQALRWGSESGLSSSRRAQCWCQLYDSTVDQAYVGWLKENDPIDAEWVSAVDATAGRLITHPQAPESTVIIAYYSSSSGGHTDNNLDGLGHTSLLPYTIGVPDPWSVDPLAENPVASWTREFTASTIAAAVGLDTVTGLAITARNSSGSVAEVAISGTIGGANTTITRSGRSLKSALGLRSIFFSVGASSGSVVPMGTPGLCETPPPPDSGFGDVSSSSVHKGDIDCVSHLGVIPGISMTAFGPTLMIPRSDMALFMARAAAQIGVSLPTPVDQGFTDIGSLSSEEQDAINQLAILGVTKGTGDDQYSPSRTIDRWQMAIFLMRLHLLLGFDAPASSQMFTDMGNHPAETVLAIHQLFALGITKGCFTNPARYCPERQVSRQEMSSFLARLIRLDT